MKFGGSAYDRETFEEVNADIRERFGKAHTFRVGLEVKPVTSLAIRAGYNITGSGEKIDAWGEPVKSTYTKNLSFGLGYSSKGSFFADMAARLTTLPDEYFMPYSDYMYDTDGYILDPAPEILNRQSLWKVFLTIGWRF